MEAAVAIRGLTVRFGSVTAVRSLDLDVRRGEIFGFLGPNGAGKTTTIRVLLDLLRPQEGEVSVLGRAPARGAAPRQRIGFLPGDLALFPFLTGEATLRFFARLYGVEPVDRGAVLAALKLPRDALDRKVRTYSTGMRQKLGITVALQHDPELLVLDEPTTGLDPLVRDAFLGLLRERRARGRTVLFSSHVLAEVEACADRVGLIHEGRLHLVEEIEAVHRRLPRRVALRYEDGRRVSYAHEGSARELLAGIEPEGLLDLEVRPADLADVFRSIVAGGREEKR